jgi:hypothetical protein
MFYLRIVPNTVCAGLYSKSKHYICLFLVSGDHIVIPEDIARQTLKHYNLDSYQKLINYIIDCKINVISNSSDKIAEDNSNISFI